MRRMLPAAALAVVVTGLWAPLGCGSHGGGNQSPRDASLPEMLTSRFCGNCHTDHYDDWSGSMHAYAADDPVFLAMNKRGQRETNGQLGNFCVNCHAPMFVRQNPGKNMGQALADGQAVPEELKGVTCYFCHSIESVNPAHNNGLVNLASDLVMRGEIRDPVPSDFHKSTYSTLQDRDSLDSSTMCGSCHDIVTPMIGGAGGAHLERTFCEWNKAGFNVAGANTCASKCHMTQSNTKRSIAPKVPSAPPRFFHQHDFPAVDVALDPSFLSTHPKAAQGPQTVQTTLNAGVLRGALCVTALGGIRVVIDDFGLGHQWPSGAAQDRRLWAEVIAYSGTDPTPVYKSGVVADRMPVTSDNDADLWLLRDDMLDSQSKPVTMFWQAVTSSGNELPAPQFKPSVFSTVATHIGRSFPKDGSPVSKPFDRVTLRMRLQPIGLDVLDDLVQSGDLDASVVASVPRPFDVTLLPESPATPMLEWKSGEKSAYGTFKDPDNSLATCVGSIGLDPSAPSPPQSGVTCKP